MMKKRAFTLIELLIVIAIISILAAAIIPNFVGFDTEARITATKTNLDTLRTRVILFRAKEGRYPDGLGELIKTYYLDVGVKKAYLKKIPNEMISSKSGDNSYIDAASAQASVSQEGGWIYYKDSAEVYINIDEPLSKKWGEFEGESPSQW